MNAVLNLYSFLPALMLCLQAFIFLAGTIMLLRFVKILQLPYAGMDYAGTVKAAAILLSVMIISFSDITAVIQTVKVFHNYGDNFYSNLFIKFSQFILIVFLTICIFELCVFFAIRVIPGLRQSTTTEGDIPGAVLQAIIMLVIAVYLHVCAKEIIETITPKYINFS